MKTVGKIIGTGIVATACNFVTGCIASKDMRGPVSNNDLPLKIIVGTASGFLLSTAPAIVMTAATNIASLSVLKSTVVGVIATYFGYDDYLNLACPNKNVFTKTIDRYKSFSNIIESLAKSEENMFRQIRIESLKLDISSYTQKVYSDENFKLAYKLNTIGQNFLFNYIWESSDDSTPELENGNSELLSKAH